MRIQVLLYLSLVYGPVARGQTQDVPTETGTASFYARRFEGRRCASGEVFRHDSLTAAHKSLPFGTRVRVTNVHNDSVVVLRINDRLPRRSTRLIDVSHRAAQHLNFVKQGLARVKLEVLPEAQP